MNLSSTEKQVLQQYFAGIPVKRAYLFGSMARNEAGPESDIDILIELDHSTPIGMRFFLYRSELEELLHKKIDLVTTEGLSRHVKPVIDKDKILIYERINH
jgi:predicted nucleotidyltransferase